MSRHHEIPGASVPRAVPEAPAAEWGREVDYRDQLSGLLSRHSTGPRWLTQPGPSLTELQQAIACALRAPDHGQLVPWRAMLVTPEQRDALGERFAEFARAVGKSDEEEVMERTRAHKGPVLVAWVAKVIPGIPEVPVHEQWITVGGALTNFLNALHLMGYGAKTLSGRKCQHPAVRDAFCDPDEALVAFICAGTPTKLGTARVGDDVEAAFTVWEQR